MPSAYEDIITEKMSDFRDVMGGVINGIKGIIPDGDLKEKAGTLIEQVEHRLFKVQPDLTFNDLCATYGCSFDDLLDSTGLSGDIDINSPLTDYFPEGTTIDVPKTSYYPSNANQVNITKFGSMPGEDRTLYAVWQWGHVGDTDKYDIEWWYDVGFDWIIGNKTQDSQVFCYYNTSTYSYPENAKRVRFLVKPYAKEYDDGYVPWYAEWSNEIIFNVSEEEPPRKPNNPSDIKIENNVFIATVTDIEGNADELEFEIVRQERDAQSTVPYARTSVKVDKEYKFARIVTPIESGYLYGVRVRAYFNGMYSEWTNVSSYVASKADVVTNVSITLDSVNKIETDEGTSYVYYMKSTWDPALGATSYTIEYTTDPDIFIYNPDSVTKVESPSNIFDGPLLAAGVYYFRVKANNDSSDNDKAEYSEILKIPVGEHPNRPTVWVSDLVTTVDNSLTLYWIHNSPDGGKETEAIITYSINGKLYQDGIDVIKTDQTTVSSYTFTREQLREWMNDPEYPERKTGYTLSFGVRTFGPDPNVMSPADSTNSILVYSSINLTFEMQYGSGPEKGWPLSGFTRFPILATAHLQNNAFKPLRYTVTCYAKDSYVTMDNMGKTKIVNANEAIFNKTYEPNSDGELNVELGATDIQFENNQWYGFRCTAITQSSLTVSEEHRFEVMCYRKPPTYAINAEIGINRNNYTAAINPYAEYYNHELVENVTLDVYRRQFDNSYILIAGNLPNDRGTFVTDPHPALDYARYRIVATSSEDGSMSYFDVPAAPIGGKSIVIQWAEEYTTFSSASPDRTAERNWGGSVLMLPYDVDISDNVNPEVEFVNYSGRENPVSYYGDKKDYTSTWNATIPKEDVDTIYLLRRLQNWKGDVYIREPSGTGYWANVKVSFDLTHVELTSKVTINVTRVEGGI